MLPDALIALLIRDHDATKATARLRDDEPPFGLDRRESVCPLCNLVHWSKHITPCLDCTN